MREDWRERILERPMQLRHIRARSPPPTARCLPPSQLLSLSPQLPGSPSRRYIYIFIIFFLSQRSFKASPPCNHAQLSSPGGFDVSGMHPALRWYAHSYILIRLEKAGQRKQEKRRGEGDCMDGCQLFLWFSSCLLHPPLRSPLLNPCVCIYATRPGVHVVSTRMLGARSFGPRHQVTDDNGRLAAERTGMEHDGVCACLSICVV